MSKDVTLSEIEVGTELDMSQNAPITGPSLYVCLLMGMPFITVNEER